MSGPIRVLHVDDDPDFGDLVETTLEREDDRFAVDTATSAAEGLDRIAEVDYHCVVSDYEMPGRNGVEFLTAVREAQPDLPFILFTGKGSEEVASEAISAGVSDYLRKGRGAERYSLLANRINNLVSQHRAERRLAARAAQQERVAELGQLALAGEPVESLFERAVAFVAGTLGTDYAKVLDYRPEREDLRLRAGVGWREGLVGAATVGTGEDSQAGHTLRSEEPIVVEDLRTEDRFRGPDLLVEHDVVSGVSVIIGSPDEPWGVLGTHTTEPTAFSDDEVTFVQNVANVLANAIERRSTEDRLRETRQWYQQLLAHLSDFLLVVDDAGEIAYASPAIERTTGFEPDEVVGTNAFEYVHPADREAAAAAFAETLEDPGREVRIEYRAETADGSHRWIEARGTNYLDDPVIEGVLVSVREVTERKRRERELREKRNQLEAIVENTAEAIFIKDDEGVYRFVNESAAELFGLEQGEMVGRTDAELFSPDDAADIRADDEAVLESGEPVTYEEARRIDGERYVFLSDKYPYRDENGDVVGVMGISRNVTERIQRERELAEANKRLELALDTVELGIYDWYVQEEQISFDRRVAGMLGFPVEEFENDLSAWRERAHPDDLDAAREPLYAMLRGEVEIAVGEYRVRTRDGEWLWIRSSGMVVDRDEDGEPVRVIGLHQDIDEHKRRERELERQNERLEEFAGVVSHDLRNPLNVFAGRLELAREECDSGQLDAMERSIDRMDRIIENLLWLAREGRDIGAVEPVALGEVAEDAWAVVAGDATGAELDVAGDPLTVEADADRLRQLLENLLRNAIEHGGPDVAVRVERTADGFAIEDDGPGIPASDRERVFESGYSTKDGGTGFGLRIVGQIAEAHGWDVSVTEAASGGARFEVRDVDVVE